MIKYSTIHHFRSPEILRQVSNLKHTTHVCLLYIVFTIFNEGEGLFDIKCNLL